MVDEAYGKHLASAMFLAAKTHQRQVDKAGRPYLLHVLAVAGKVLNDGLHPDVVVAAILHDVVEDSADQRLARKEIRENFPVDIVRAVDCLTRRSGETYREYIQRVKRSDTARKVKLADLWHNTLPERAVGPTLSRRYREARRELLSCE